MTAPLTASTPNSSDCCFHQGWLVLLSTILIFFTHSLGFSDRILQDYCDCAYRLDELLFLPLALSITLDASDMLLLPPLPFSFEPRLSCPNACPVWLLVDLGGRLWFGAKVVLRIVLPNGWFDVGEDIWSAITTVWCLGPVCPNWVGWFTRGICCWRLVTILGLLAVPFEILAGPHPLFGWFVVICGCCTAHCCYSSRFCVVANICLVESLNQLFYFCGCSPPSVCFLAESLYLLWKSKKDKGFPTISQLRCNMKSKSYLISIWSTYQLLFQTSNTTKS